MDYDKEFQKRREQAADTVTARIADNYAVQGMGDSQPEDNILSRLQKRKIQLDSMTARTEYLIKLLIENPVLVAMADLEEVYNKLQMDEDSFLRDIKYQRNKRY